MFVGYIASISALLAYLASGNKRSNITQPYLEKDMKLTNYYILLFCTLLLAFTDAVAQSSDSEYRKGLQFLRSNDYSRALNHFEEALFIDANNTNAAYQAGICHLNLRSPFRALELFEVVEKNSNGKPENPEFLFYIGVACYQNQQFFRAQKYLNQFEKTIPSGFNRAELEEVKRRLENATTLYDNPNGFIVENLGPSINSDGPEYSAIVSPDHKTMFYTERKHFRTKNAKTDQLNWEAVETIKKVQANENGDWGIPTNVDMPTPVSGSHKATVQLYDGGNKMLIFHNSDLYTVEFTNGSWAKPERMSKNINSSGREAHGFITKDGNTLIFSTDIFSDNGDLDLMYSTKTEAGDWEMPKPIAELNTPNDEDAPFLAEDGYLYFSSNGHNTIGGFDIFRSKYDKNLRRWSKPENLGYPINSVNDDIFFTLYEDNIGYFTSNRSGGYGQEDIYRTFLFSTLELEGVVYDVNSGNPVPNSRIRFVDENTVRFVNTDEAGRYRLEMPFNMDYTVKIFRENILRHQQYFRLDFNPKSPRLAKQDFYIDLNKALEDRLLAGEKNLPRYIVKGRVTDEKTKKPLEAEIALLDNQNSGLMIANTTSNTDGRYQIELVDIEGDYTVMAYKNQYISKGKQFFVIDAVKGVIERDIEMSEAKVGSSFVMRNIYFDFDMAIVKEVSFPSLNRLIKFMQDNQSIKIEISGHTDSIGDENYNMQLSYRRARAVAQYLTARGITMDRLVVIGHGESRPIASNDDEIDGRELNRRIEVKILDNNMITAAQ